MVQHTFIMEDDDDLEALRLAALQTIRPRISSRSRPVASVTAKIPADKGLFFRPVSTNPNLITIVPTVLPAVKVETAKQTNSHIETGCKTSNNTTIEILTKASPPASLSLGKVKNEVPKKKTLKVPTKDSGGKPSIIDRKGIRQAVVQEKNKKHEEKPKTGAPVVKKRSDSDVGFSDLELEEDVLDFEAAAPEEDTLDLHDSDSDSLERLMEQIEEEINSDPVKPFLLKTRKQHKVAPSKVKSPVVKKSVKEAVEKEAPTPKQSPMPASSNKSVSPQRKASPPKKSPSPRKRSPSPRKRSPLPRKRSLSPRKRSLSPRRRSITPRKRTPSPLRQPFLRKRSLSPRRRSPSPRRERLRSFSRGRGSLSPRRRSLSPKYSATSPSYRIRSPYSSYRARSPSWSPRPLGRRRSLTPRRRSISPRRKSLSPRRRDLSPRRRSITPRRRSISPRRRTPLSLDRDRRRRSITPRRRSLTPKKRSLTPRKRSLTPKKRSNSPRRRSVSPRKQGESPKRRANQGTSPMRVSSPGGLRRKRSRSPLTQVKKVIKRPSPVGARRPWARNNRNINSVRDRLTLTTKHYSNKNDRNSKPNHMNSSGRSVTGSHTTQKQVRDTGTETDNSSIIGPNPVSTSSSNNKPYQNHRDNSRRKSTSTEDNGTNNKSNTDTKMNGEITSLDPKLAARKKKFETISLVEPINKKIRLKSEFEESQSLEVENKEKELNRKLQENYEKEKVVEIKQHKRKRIILKEEPILDIEEKPVVKEPPKPVPLMNITTALEPKEIRHRERRMKRLKERQEQLKETIREEMEEKEVVEPEEEEEEIVEERVLKKKRKKLVSLLEKEEQSEEVEEQTGGKKGVDLRAELSRRRAERMKGATSSLDPMARIVQSALEGAVGKIKSRSKSSKVRSESESASKTEKKARSKGRRVHVLAASKKPMKTEESDSSDNMEEVKPVRLRRNCSGLDDFSRSDEEPLGDMFQYSSATSKSPPTSGRSILRRNQGVELL